MAELNSLIYSKLIQIENILRDIRFGLQIGLEEEIIGASVASDKERSLGGNLVERDEI